MHVQVLNKASATQSINGERRAPRTLAALAASLAGALGLVAFAAPAQAQAVPHAMTLGAVTAPPPGFLDFCARLPDQCGIATLDAEGRPVTEAGLRDRLYHQYYWAMAFSSASSGAAAPASGARAPHAQPAGWSAIFGAVAPPAPTPAAASAAAVTDEPATAGAPLAASPAVMAELDKVNLYVNGAIRYVSDRTLYGNQDYWHLALGPGGKGAGDCKDYVLEKRRALIADGIPAADLSIAIVQTGWGETHAILLVSTDRGELVLDSLSQWVQPWWKVHYHWLKRQAPGQQLSWVSLG